MDLRWEATQPVMALQAARPSPWCRGKSPESTRRPREIRFLLALEAVKILANVSGSARSGKLTCILGPSGSGKTTLLNVGSSETMKCWIYGIMSGTNEVLAGRQSGGQRHRIRITGKVHRFAGCKLTNDATTSSDQGMSSSLGLDAEMAV